MKAINSNLIQIHTSIAISEQQFAQINALWNENYPIELKNRFPLLLTENKVLIHYIIYEGEQIIAWAIIFESEGEKRFSIIVGKSHQGKGIGCLLLNRIKSDNSIIYGWVIHHNESLLASGEIYTNPLPFYIKNDFDVLDERLETEIIRAVKIRFQKP